MNETVPINLDTMDPEDLWKFWKKYHVRSVKRARDIGLTSINCDHPLRAMWALAAYASNKHTAIKCRLCGRIKEAKIYEDICEKIYKTRIPDVAKW